MSYVNLMAYVNADHISKQFVGVTACVADKFSARLIGLSALAVIPPLVAEGVVVVDTATEFDIAEMKAKLGAAKTDFQAAAGAGRQIEWRSIIGFPTETLIDEARSADLIIVEKGRSGDIYRTVNTGAALLGAGRPFLVVPAAVKTLVADHVVVGWKDAREAQRAVQDALPFLHEARRVTVIELCEKSEMDTSRQHVEDVVRYLAHHRIKAELRVEMQADGSGADQIIGFAEDEDADLLVTGAYGHSRLNEWIFGGMTRDLLTSSPICCLMSH
jgi:nucleotide-binding universal stress UspA family protein